MNGHKVKHETQNLATMNYKGLTQIGHYFQITLVGEGLNFILN